MRNPIRAEKKWDPVYRAFHSHPHSRTSVWDTKPTPFFIRLIEFLKQEGAKTVLDAGCGDGRNIGPFLEAGFHVIGADASSFALAICKKQFKNNPNLELVQEDIGSISQPKGIDIVLCDYVLVHVKNAEQALDSFYRLLQKGGFTMIGFTSPLDSTFGKGEKISENEFLHKGIYFRYDSLEDVYRLMHRFKILCITSEYCIQPSHGPGYVRKGKHRHHSYFVLARKE